MTIEMPALLEAVAATHASAEEIWQGGNIKVVRIYGGANNALYRVEAGGNSFACKLCVADERRRAAREYSALRLLEDAKVDVAPCPLWFDATYQIVPFPAVIYSWLDGRSLDSVPSEPQLASLVEIYQRIHALSRHDYNHYNLPEAWFHWFDYQPYLAELDSFLARYGTWFAGTSPDGRQLYNRMEVLVRRCKEFVQSPKAPNPDRSAVHIGLCRVDPNLANCIWQADQQIRWVDWEYSGWGDPALELADIRWHSSWMGLSEEQHASLRSRYTPPPSDQGFAARLNLWDRLVSTRWPFLVLRNLWSIYNGPDRVRLTQPAGKPEELQSRIVRLIERAERFDAENPLA